MTDESIPDDVPEADALEQRREVGEPPAGDDPGVDSIEVPEADALDQAREVGYDDEPDPGA